MCLRFPSKHLVDSIIYITFAEYIRQPKTIMQEHTLSDNGCERLNSGAVTSQINGVGGGRFIASAPRSEYFRFDHSFIPGERVRGSFVRFDKMGTGLKVYALFDLEDGRKTRVDVKYLNFLNGREAMFMPGDKVTMTANDYSTRLNQPSWKIESTPRRFDRYRSAELNRKVWDCLFFPENLLQLGSWAKLPLGDSQHSLFIIMPILCNKGSNREKGDFEDILPIYYKRSRSSKTLNFAR